MATWIPPYSCDITGSSRRHQRDRQFDDTMRKIYIKLKQGEVGREGGHSHAQSAVREWNIEKVSTSQYIDFSHIQRQWGSYSSLSQLLQTSQSAVCQLWKWPDLRTHPYSPIRLNWDGWENARHWTGRWHTDIVWAPLKPGAIVTLWVLWTNKVRPPRVKIEGPQLYDKATAPSQVSILLYCRLFILKRNVRIRWHYSTNLLLLLFTHYHMQE